MIAANVKTAQITAMKAGEKDRVAATRAILAAIKQKEIDTRVGAGNGDDKLAADVLTKMAKQRRESIGMYEQGDRQELADQERSELAVIEEFMPQMMPAAEAQAEVRKLVEALGAEGPQDMGKVMAALKERFAGQIDMSSASAMVKQELTAKG
ncbi:GatB/YqeY domain-containing protein [Pacificimonas sp. WHA3]|uniref:GatB/YqeY domain-containing protein n=1 Tax=Pacificimonas pallii TaxID=2827236 RepID=A0ABS6SEK5_9SPHN|nr:GatB/YqeY domain-containing protein [Pacificimonas pallii]MBV7256838.1 GatB/YqeY domain-containing protein [Pacificimonas pallii]